MAAKSESIGSCTIRRCPGDTEQPEKNPALCKAAALGGYSDVACGPGCHCAVARADLLTTRSVWPKVPTDPSAERARAGGSVAACGRASVGTALATTGHRGGVATALTARRRPGVSATFPTRRGGGGVATALTGRRGPGVSATLPTRRGGGGVATALTARRRPGVSATLPTDACCCGVGTRGREGGVRTSLPTDSGRGGIDLPFAPRCVRSGIDAFSASRSHRPSLAAGRWSGGVDDPLAPCGLRNRIDASWSVYRCPATGATLLRLGVHCSSAPWISDVRIEVVCAGERTRPDRDPDGACDGTRCEGWHD
jgi:hypothetical protein